MPEQKKCSFCGKNESEVNVLIAGMEGYICDQCVKQALKIVDHELTNKKQEVLEKELKLGLPREIKSFLDEYVIGQDEAKKTLSVAVYNHYKRILNRKKDNHSTTEIQKSNVIIIGETGTGKTLLAKTIARLLNVPFTIVDATVLTQAGYVGEDVESILSRLLQDAGYEVERAEMGIIFIDEIDKVARKGDNPSITRDVSGEGVQQALLKILEGSVVNVPPQGGRKHPDQKYIQLDTTNILFITGGAFVGIQNKISSRLNTSVIGYGASRKESIDKTNLLKYVNAQDLRAFGLIPELIGRLPVVTYLDPLDKEGLLRILTEPKNSLIKQYTELFALDKVQLTIEQEALEAIVDYTLELKLGARGLRSLCEAIFKDYMFHIDEYQGALNISKEDIEKKMKVLNLPKAKPKKNLKKDELYFFYTK